MAGWLLQYFYLVLVLSLLLPYSNVYADDCEKAKELLKINKSVNYQWGGDNPKTGFDCSGLISYVFKYLGKPIPRTTSRKLWISIDDNHFHWSNSECLDLVWWTLTPDRPFGHIGIMMKNDNFWHSSSSLGVTGDKFIINTYWDKNFEGCKRIN